MNEYETATENAAFVDFTNQSIIEIAGTDAREFLHNLCTQDVKNLPVGDGCEAFLTTSKARVVAHVGIAHPQKDVLWLDFVAGQGETVYKHLQHFLISERAEISDRTGEIGMLRVIGPKASERLATIAGSSLDGMTPWQQSSIAHVGMIRRQRMLALDGFDFFAPIADVPALRDRFTAKGINAVSRDTYEILRIEAGLPEYGIDIDENRLAMEVNRSNAISYKKGCYLGQETIVMARDRGQVNRLFMGVKVVGSEPLSASAKIYHNAQEVGQATSSIFSPRLQQVIALAYLRRGSWDAGTEVVIDAVSDGRTGVVCALPFAAGPLTTVA